MRTARWVQGLCVLAGFALLGITLLAGCQANRTAGGGAEVAAADGAVEGGQQGDADDPGATDDASAPEDGADADEEQPETDAILPGVGLADITVGESTRAEIAALYGEPEGSLADSDQYASLGLFVFFDEQDVADKLLLRAPYAGQTAGGNGIGGSLEEFRAEFGDVDVPDQADNFRVWETAGIAVDFDRDGLAEGIEIIAVP